ncbi:MAG: alpha-hydroxy acid oxidase [Bacteroidota bacterium]
MSYKKFKRQYLNQYPAISDLAQKARQRIPNVAWEYLQTGTGNEQLLRRNTSAFDDIVLQPQFCKGELVPDLQTTFLGQSFDAPFGIAPVGLTGLMWPQAEILLARTARHYQIPFTLSTVATETPETLAPHIGNIGWFQLYPPNSPELRAALLDRAKKAGFHTLIVTADVPIPSRRERTRRAGLQMPPKITPNFIWQALTHPTWTLRTLRNGLPRLRTIAEYAKEKSIKGVSFFVQKEWRGSLSWEYCEWLRDNWDGPVLLKGVLHPKDAEKAIQIGLDGIIVSNHGGRQFDAAPATIKALPEIVRVAKGKTAILFDSGIRTGLDILRALSLGAEFVLLGRAFIYGVAALGQHGSDHVVEILKDDLKNNMIQLGIERLDELKGLH